MNDIIKIKKSLGDLCVLLDGVTTEPAGADQSIFIFNNIRKKKINETILKLSQGSVTVLQKMANYQQGRVKVTNTQLNKLKSAAKNKTGTI